MTTSLPFFLLASVLVLLSTEVYSRPQEDGHQDDRPEVPSPDISLKMRQLKDESVMSIILRETEMVDPPVVTTPTHIPEHLLNLLLEKKVEEFALGEEEYLIFYPLNDNTACNHEMHCAKYQFKLPSDSKPVSSVHLWIKKKIQSLDVEVMACLSPSQENIPCENQEQLRGVKYDSLWSAFELPIEFLTNAGYDPLFCTVEIFGLSTQDYGDRKPAIVANVSPTAVKRVRRSTKNDSSKNCTCCLLDYYVSFKELGWSWIIAPLGFNANVCYGKCDYQLDSYSSNYHGMMSKILLNKTISGDKNDNLWTPHCVPTKLKSLHVIYITSESDYEDSSNAFVQQTIPDIITESCGCF